MYYAGIDIGSTAAKAVLFHNNEIKNKFVMPTGWNSTETADKMKKTIMSNIDNNDKIKFAATGYGRVSVPYADKVITEITCHGKGAFYLLKENCTVIDIGGQDTKIIKVENGRISDFLMNDKCSAGTGRFLEVMANTLGVDIDMLCRLASKGGGTSISSMCTVFAESEVISLIGRGEKIENISYAVIESIINKVLSLCNKLSKDTNYYLTGGLCDCSYIVANLSSKLETQVKTNELARYAGAIGAALSLQKICKKQ